MISVHCGAPAKQIAAVVWDAVSAVLGILLNATQLGNPVAMAAILCRPILELHATRSWLHDDRVKISLRVHRVWLRGLCIQKINLSVVGANLVQLLLVSLLSFSL